MKAILIPFLSLLIPLTPQSAFAQSEPELKLESVVIVSRHGVRAPTKATQLMQDVTPARSQVRSRLLLMSTNVPVKQAEPSPPGWHLTVQ